MAAGEVQFDDLAREFGVSAMTIRRDAAALENSTHGAVRRVRGGLASFVPSATEPPLSVRRSKENSAKVAIAAEAAKLVSNGDTVLFDVGTTVLEAARFLVKAKRFTAVTASIPVAQVLAENPDLTTYVIGGTLRTAELSMAGNAAQECLGTYYCDISFLGVGGIAPSFGFSDYSVDSAQMKRACISSSRRRVALADGTKLGLYTFAKFASIDDIDLLITDASAPENIVRALRNEGLEVQVVPPPVR
jgi:DeoR/GlpR family transcriptional regulator of sugar metabolism